MLLLPGRFDRACSCSHLASLIRRYLCALQTRRTRLDTYSIGKPVGGLLLRCCSVAPTAIAEMLRRLSGI